MTKNFENGNLDSLIDDILDKVDPVDRKKVEDRLLLAARIGDLIAEKGLSKKQFADLMDQEPSVISKWLSGTHNFTQDTLSAISYKLNVPMAEFYREKQAPIVFRSSFGVAGHIEAPSRFYGGGPGVAVVYADENYLSLAGPSISQQGEWLISSSVVPLCTDIQNYISLKCKGERHARKREHPEGNIIRKA